MPVSGYVVLLSVNGNQRATILIIGRQKCSHVFKVNGLKAAFSAYDFSVGSAEHKRMID